MDGELARAQSRPKCRILEGNFIAHPSGLDVKLITLIPRTPWTPPDRTRYHLFFPLFSSSPFRLRSKDSEDDAQGEEPAATKSSVNDARDDEAANDVLGEGADEYDSADDASEEDELEVDETEEDPDIKTEDDDDEDGEEEPAAVCEEESISDRNVNVR